MQNVQAPQETDVERKARRSALKKFLKDFRAGNITDMFEKAKVKKKKSSKGR